MSEDAKAKPGSAGQNPDPKPAMPQLGRRLFMFRASAVLGGAAATALATTPQQARAQTDNDPNDSVGRGRTGRTDNDPNDGSGRGRRGGTDNDPTDGAGSGRGRGTGRSDNDPNDSVNQGRTGRTDNDPNDGVGRGRGR